MFVYTPESVLLEILRTQLLEYALANSQKRKFHKVTKRELRMQLVTELLQFTSITKHQCWTLYKNIIKTMIAQEEPKQSIDIIAEIHKKIQNKQQIKQQYYISVHELLTNNRIYRISQSQILKLINPKIHSYIKVDEQKQTITQRVIMRQQKEGSINIKEYAQAYIMEHMPKSNTKQYYKCIFDIIKQIKQQTKDIHYLFGGGTGQFVSLIHNYPSYSQQIKDNFSIGDVDLKVININNKQFSEQEFRSIKNQILNAILKVQINDELNKVFSYKVPGFTIKPLDTQFLRTIATDGTVQYEIFRLKRTYNPIVFDTIELRQSGNTIAIVFRIKYLVEAVSDKGSLQIKADLVDISLSNDFNENAKYNDNEKPFKDCGDSILKLITEQELDDQQILDTILNA